MDGQVEKAIELAWSPTSDASVKQQAFDFLNQLRADPAGREACLALFTRTAAPARAPEYARVVALDVINHAVQTQDCDVASLTRLRDELWAYVRRAYGSGDPAQADAPPLQNKLAQTVTFLFTALYSQGWERFVDDVLAITTLPGTGSGAAAEGGVRDNAVGVVLYLRILATMHDEIAEQLMSRTEAETRRNTELKDLLRARDMHKITASWQQIFAQWRDRSDGIAELGLKVMGKWVSWIDISLALNQDILNVLFQLAGRTVVAGAEDKVRNAAIDTFTEIVAKKMKPADKVSMIRYLNLDSIVSQLIASPALADLRTTSSYDTDFAEVVAKLVNILVTDVIKVLENAQAEPETRTSAQQLLQAFVSPLLRFFSDEYDEVCVTVIPALTDLLTYLRKSSPLPSEFVAMLSPILNAVVRKMRYDSTSSWGEEDEQTDEAEFQDLRKKLQVLQKIVAAVDLDLYTESLSTVVGDTFQKLEQTGGQMDWRDLDLALHEMFLFGELAVSGSSLYAKGAPCSVAAERLIAMMEKMVQSDIAAFSHPAIQLQYMEICVRYCSFFDHHTPLIPRVLENFVRLVHHNHVKIKTRSKYLFLKFVRHLRAQLGGLAETVIQSIADLLPIKAEVPTAESADDDVSSNESDNSPHAAFMGQLCLFEAIGWISSTSAVSTEKQILIMQSIMNPLFNEMEQHLPRAKAGNAQSTLQIHHVIMALGALGNGFSSWTPGSAAATADTKAPAAEVKEEFSRAAEAILVSLESLKTSMEVRTAARGSFSRLLGVMGVRMLPMLPRWIDGLLSSSSTKDEMAMFLRLLDQVVFGFKQDIFQVLDSLLTPLLQRVYVGLAEPINGTDDEIQLGELQREYLTFIQVILNNDLGSVLVSATNQQAFEALILSITALAKNTREGSGALPASRLAFSILTRMVDLWGGPDVARLGSEPSGPSSPPAPSFPGFDRFMMERFHPVGWEVLQDVQFRPDQDAQAKQVLVEIAALEQKIYVKTGEVFLDVLRRDFFPAMGLDGTSFMTAMVTSSDKKGFAGFIQTFLRERR